MAVNNAAVAKYGYSLEEFLSMTIADIRPNEDLPALKSNVAAVTDGHSNAGVWRHLLKSGELIYVDITGHTIEHQGHRAELIAARDVTERVESANELARAKRMLEIAGTLAKFGAWRYEVTSDKLEWSTETARIHDEPDGFSPKIVDALAYYAAEHRDRIAAVFQECIDRGQAFDETLQIITAKGRRIWVRATGEADCKETGQIVAVEGAFQDITDLIVARDDAMELSKRLLLTLEGMSDAFFLLDEDWNFAFVNTQAQKMLRRDKGDLLGKNVWQEFPEAVGSKFQFEYERAVTDGEPVCFEEYYPSLETWFEVSAEPTATGLAVYFSDITGERRRSEQLRLLEAAVMHQNDLLVITEVEPIDGPDGPKIVYVNDAFVQRTGFSRDEVIGRTPRILQGPKTQRDELDRIRNALVEWEPVRAELINYTKSGEEFWLELDIVPLADETGCFTHWISVERDITERKKWEQDLETSEERFRLVARAGGSVVWEWDILCNEQWWSEGLTEIFGHPPEPAKTAPTVWSAHVHPDDRPRIDAALEDLCARRAYFFKEQYRFRRADGSWAIVEDCGFARRDAE
jgi:PAS domain S-box-containing protein